MSSPRTDPYSGKVRMQLQNTRMLPFTVLRDLSSLASPRTSFRCNVLSSHLRDHFARREKADEGGQNDRGVRSGKPGLG
jgi:hypothetical protein